MITLVLALRGFVAIFLLAALVGGLPRTVQLGIAVLFGVWAAALAQPPVLALDGLPTSLQLAAVIPLAVREAVIGASLGIAAAMPLLVAQTAGRLVDRASAARGTYTGLFAILAAAVFVGIDGHVAVLTTIATSFRDVPAVTSVQPHVLALLAALLGGAVQLALPWLITAAVVELAVGIGMRVGARAVMHAPVAAAVPAALVMITATLVSTLAVAIAAIIRAAFAA